MAIPRKVGLPVTPPPNRGDGNAPKLPTKAPGSPQNPRGEEQPPKRPNPAQNSQQKAVKRKEDLAPPAKRQKPSEDTINQELPRRKERSAQSEQRRVRQQPIKESTVEKSPEVEEGYAIDEETGIKYRVLPGAKADAVKKFNSLKKSDLENLTFSSMKYFFTEAEDFDIDDLNSTAEDFLGHLRVPPNKEEQKKLREERLKRKREQNQKFADEQERLTAKYGSLEPDEHEDD